MATLSISLNYDREAAKLAEDFLQGRESRVMGISSSAGIPMVNDYHELWEAVRLMKEHGFSVRYSADADLWYADEHPTMTENAPLGVVAGSFELCVERMVAALKANAAPITANNGG